MFEMHALLIPLIPLVLIILISLLLKIAQMGHTIHLIQILFHIAQQRKPTMQLFGPYIERVWPHVLEIQRLWQIQQW